MIKERQSKEKSFNFMKFLKAVAIGTTLITLGSSYTINTLNASAMENNNNENNTDKNDNKGLSVKSKQEIAENAKVEASMQRIEEEHPIVEGAKITKYTYVSGNDYVKDGNFYKVYRINWTKTSKVSYAGVAVRTASSYEKVMYSKSGNHVESRAKLTSKQKTIINTLNKSKTYSKKFRYVAVYNTNAKITELFVIPKSGMTAKYELSKVHAYGFDSKENINLPAPTKSVPLKSTTKIGYNLNVLPHVDTYKNWYNAFVSGGSKKNLFHGYSIPLETVALKMNSK